MFKIAESFIVPIKRTNKIKQIDLELAKKNFSSHAAANRAGCYIFYVKAGKGHIPIYVGKTSKSLCSEIFTPHKINKINSWLLESAKKGTLKITFIITPIRQGVVNDTQIKSLEKWLIDISKQKNYQLLNKHHTMPIRWSIQGVNSGKGKPTKDATLFKNIIF